MLADDPNHPIPSVVNADIIAEREGDGVDLIIIIASPLDADERSQERLLAKFDNYVGYINSGEFRREFGAPSREKVSILVMIHPDSHPAIFELLERARPWVEEANASLEVIVSSLQD